MRRRDDRGYTMIELVVVMLIFSIVMTLIAGSFSRMVTGSGQLLKSAETDIGGLIGLELLRLDLGLAGFGLPWSVPGMGAYTEPTPGTMVAGFPGTEATLYRDEPPVAPRAIVTGDNVGYNGSDYLVLKGTPLAMNQTCRSWSYLAYSPGGAELKPSKSEQELKLGENDRAIVLRSTYLVSGAVTRELVTDGPGSSAFTLVLNDRVAENFQPKSGEETRLVYGVAPAKKDSGGNDQPLAFPYNRADYYLSRPADSSKTNPICADNTGILYKYVMSQNGGNPPPPYPILNCVADMQVVFLADTNLDGKIDYHLNDLNMDDQHIGIISSSSAAAEEIRKQLKEVRVYILAQQGKKDPGYLYPSEQMPLRVGEKIGGTLYGSEWSESAMASKFGSDWRNYHWKVFIIVVEPKNL